VSRHQIQYVPFEKVSPDELLPILNNEKLREHLMPHPEFDMDSAREWKLSKIEVDNTEGCRVRAVIINGELVGWCGIQLEYDHYELAIIIDDQYWGLGVKVFKQLLAWAEELGHQSVTIHFYHTRPKYKFLQKRSQRVYESELYGQRFTTYELIV